MCAPVCANSSCTTARLVSCLAPFLWHMTLVGTPIRPEVLVAAPASIREAWSGLLCTHQNLPQSSAIHPQCMASPACRGCWISFQTPLSLLLITFALCLRLPCRPIQDDCEKCCHKVLDSAKVAVQEAGGVCVCGADWGGGGGVGGKGSCHVSMEFSRGELADLGTAATAH